MIRPILHHWLTKWLPYQLGITGPTKLPTNTHISPLAVSEERPRVARQPRGGLSASKEAS